MIAPDEMRAWLGATAADDAMIADLIRQGVATVQTQTGRYFGGPRDFLEFWPAGDNDIWLTEQPRTDVPVVVEGWHRDAWEVVPAGDYTLIRLGDRGGARLRHIDSYRPWGGASQVRITYSAGYNEGNEPAEIRGYVWDWVASRWANRGREGLQSETVAGVYTWTAARHPPQGGPDVLPDHIAMWRRGVVA